MEIKFSIFEPTKKSQLLRAHFGDSLDKDLHTSGQYPVQPRSPGPRGPGIPWSRGLRDSQDPSAPPRFRCLIINHLSFELVQFYTAGPPSTAGAPSAAGAPFDVPASHGVTWARSLHLCGGIPMAEAKAWQKADGLG